MICHEFWGYGVKTVCLSFFFFLVLAAGSLLQLLLELGEFIIWILSAIEFLMI